MLRNVPSMTPGANSGTSSTPSNPTNAATTFETPDTVPSKTDGFWKYDRKMYKRRNEIARLYRPLKKFRRIFSRFEELDVVFLGFIFFGLIVDALR